MVVLIWSDREERCSWKFSESAKRSEEIVSGSISNQRMALREFMRVGYRRTVILGRRCIGKKSNFIHQLFPPSVDESEMIIVICGAFLEFCHALFELLLLAPVLFELSNDGILLNDLDVRRVSASSSMAFSSTRKGTHLEVDLPG